MMSPSNQLVRLLAAVSGVLCTILVLSRSSLGSSLIPLVNNRITDDTHSFVTTPDRPLILYAYSEAQDARENIKYFIDQGLHGAADFIFILNGETNITDIIPDEANIRVVQRPNTCYDLGAYGEVLRHNDLWKRYKRFITMNASIRGPFMPFWSERCWSDVYLDEVDDNTKLVGMSANCQAPAHIQSMIWATDRIGMQLLINPQVRPLQLGGGDWQVGYSGCYETWRQAVDSEQWTTPMINNAGYDVKALFSAWSARQNNTFFMECTNHPGNMIATEGGYFGHTLHPYETLFYKANKGVDPTLLEMMTSLHTAANNAKRSYSLCK